MEPGEPIPAHYALAYIMRLDSQCCVCRCSDRDPARPVGVVVPPVRHCLCLFSLPSWLRHCLCLVLPPPSWLRHCRCLTARPQGVAADTACRAKCPEVAANGAEGGVFAERFCHL